MSRVAPFAAFAAFLLYFVWRARREGMTVGDWLRRENADITGTPGWWKWPALAMAAVIVVWLVVISLA